MVSIPGNEYLLDHSLFANYKLCMNAAGVTHHRTDPRGHILDAAEQHFRVLGFRKTTMADIAGEAGMSAANLYRYFQSKEDLGAACCDRAMQERVRRLRDVVREVRWGAAAKLEQFIIENIRFNHELVELQPKISEMLEQITARRPDLVRQKVAALQALLAELLAAGNASGEFDVEDVVATASAVHSAILVFEVPLFVGLYPRGHYEQMARELAALLVRGLAAR
jgi:AcrR family transcriptional regulator